MNKEFKLNDKLQAVVNVMRISEPEFTTKVIGDNKVYVKTNCEKWLEWIISYENGNYKMQSLNKEEFFIEFKDGYDGIGSVFQGINIYRVPLSLRMETLYEIVQKSKLMSTIEKPVIFNVNHIQFYSDDNYDVIDVVEDEDDYDEEYGYHTMKFIVNNRFVITCISYSDYDVKIYYREFYQKYKRLKANNYKIN